MGIPYTSSSNLVEEKNHVILDKWGHVISEEVKLVSHINEFYKQLLGHAQVTSVRLDGICCSQLKGRDGKMLTEPIK